jgi:hypothetical protein
VGIKLTTLNDHLTIRGGAISFSEEKKIISPKVLEKY